MDCPAKVADALAVDYPYLEDFFVPAFLEVIRHKVLDIGRPESMEIQGSVNGQVNCVVVSHRNLTPSSIDRQGVP
jgi:hypothetical protein